MWVGEEKVRIDMVLDRFSGRVRVLVVVCCILLAVAAVIVTIGFTQQVQVRKQLLQTELKVTAAQIAGKVNGDGLLSLQPGDEGSPLYLSFARTIYEARINNTHISNAYIMRVDNGTITYVIDDFYLTHGLDSSVARIGDPTTEDQPVLDGRTHRATELPGYLYVEVGIVSLRVCPGPGLEWHGCRHPWGGRDCRFRQPVRVCQCLQSR